MPTVETPQVLSEIRAHGGLKLSAVGKLFPASRGSGVVNPSTVWRWSRVGALTPGGFRVKLEVVKVGMSFLTSAAAVDRFVVALTDASNPEASAPAKSARTDSARAKSSKAAGRRLQAAGA